MRVDTFINLLEFIYTDSVGNDLTPEGAIELYMAADLYTLDRLKVREKK